MPKINQNGLAPLILIGVLLAIGVVAASGTYYALNLTQPVKQESIIPAQNPVPPPTVNVTIEEVKQTNEDALLNMEGVEKVEVGEKDGKPCVVVFSFKETDELQNLENNGLSGYKVVVQNTK